MENTDARYRAYLNILKEELMPAMGCTEPIAVAYAAARAATVLGERPDRVTIEASDNIVKNVKSVVVPNTGGMRGIAAAAAAGIAAGDADKQLEVIACVDAAGQDRIRQFIETCAIRTLPLSSGILFDLKVTVFKGPSSAMVQISHFHTNIVLIQKNGDILYRNQDCDEINTTVLTDRTLLNVRDIVAFASSVTLSEVESRLQKMVDHNMAIAEQGMTGEWGANIGTVLRDVWGDDVKIRAKAMAAAGSDARMSGCELPVVIVSGSGNQGIAASVPVVVYARHLGVDTDTLFRALLVSCLVTIHQKTGIGRLSAYCGAVSAGVGPVPASPGFTAAGTGRSPTPLSMLWPWPRASSATGPNPPVPPKSPWPWKPGFWDFSCFRRENSFTAGTEL